MAIPALTLDIGDKIFQSAQALLIRQNPAPVTKSFAGLQNKEFTAGPAAPAPSSDRVIPPEDTAYDSWLMSNLEYCQISGHHDSPFWL